MRMPLAEFSLLVVYMHTEMGNNIEGDTYVSQFHNENEIAISGSVKQLSSTTGIAR